MPRIRFQLKDLLIAVVALGPLIKYWPPYYLSWGEWNRPPGINGAFWKAAAAVGFGLLMIFLWRTADKARSEFDNLPIEDGESGSGD